jgi:XTP/dITP diphosphohydrolase
VSRKFFGKKLVAATHNAGKLREIDDLLRPFRVNCVSAASLGLPEPAETGQTFEANAELKALAAARGSGLIALADDSGLAVDALSGDPGILSARWAGPNKDFNAAMEKVEKYLRMHGAATPAERTAQFVCALSLAWPDGHVDTFIGEVHGTLIWPPRGSKGFGYDPMFLPDGRSQTFGEMEPDEKHAISHRADAFRKLVDACFR